jgi:hypothetical protein
MAIKDNLKLETRNSEQNSDNDLPVRSSESNIVGILPLIHLKHFLFGNSLISIPFFDLGGIIADNEDAVKALLSEAIKLAQELKAANIELRHIYPVKFFEKDSEANLTGVYPACPVGRVYRTGVKFFEKDSRADLSAGIMADLTGACPACPME